MPRVKKSPKTISSRAGLILPVGRFVSLLKKDRRKSAVGNDAMVYFTGVAEFIMSEIIKGTLSCRKKTNTMIQPDHISKSINYDVEINKWLGNFIIPNSTPSSHVPSALLKKKRSRRSKKGEEVVQEQEQEQEQKDNTSDQ